MAKRYTVKQFTLAMRSLTKVPSQAAAGFAERIRGELDDQFSRGKDPYGNAWSPLRPATLKKGRHPPPLTDSGHGSRNITALVSKSAGVQLVSTVDYMRRHQEGTKNMDARPFFPVRVLPKRWARHLEIETRLATKRVIG
jgi:hypothetical protein